MFKLTTQQLNQSCHIQLCWQNYLYALDTSVALKKKNTSIHLDPLYKNVLRNM